MSPQRSLSTQRGTAATELVIPSVARDLGVRWLEDGSTCPHPPRSLATLGMTPLIAPMPGGRFPARHPTSQAPRGRASPRDGTRDPPLPPTPARALRRPARRRLPPLLLLRSSARLHSAHRQRVSSNTSVRVAWRSGSAASRTAA